MESPGSRTLARGLQVLRAVGAAADGVRVAELSTATSLDRAVLYRLLGTLADHGFVRKDPSTRRYHLGVALVELGWLAGQGLQVRRVARPIMDALMAEVGEAVCLAVLDRDGVVVVQRVEPPSLFVRVSYEVGFRHPLGQGAHGLSLAAHLDHAVADIDPRRAVEIRQQGFAVSIDELETGVSGIAAHISDQAGTVVAAIGVVAPTPRLPDPAVHADAVRSAARRITAALVG